MSTPSITVFGGSSPKPGSEAYQQAYRLGKLLADAGFTAQTGGYIGTMEAVSRGAAESGGHVIGVTCDEIERWRPIGPNPWVKQEMRRPTLRQRLFTLIDTCDAALALPGGIGTLAEIALMWAELQIQAAAPRPLILIGGGWEGTFRELFTRQGDYIADQDRQIIQFTPDVDAAVQQLIVFFKDQ